MRDMRKVKDLTGQKFGRLTVLGLNEREGRKAYWDCQCECGKVKAVRGDSLQAGAIRSCGCLKKEQDDQNLTKGYARKTNKERGYKVGGTRLYHIWQGIKRRCCDPNDKRYGDYGGRGISVCDEWLADYANFHDWALANGYSDELTIDRIDNDGNYEPSNCRWATIKEQCRNRRSNINIRIGNSVRTLIEWCEIFELDYKVVRSRYKRHPFGKLDDLFYSGRG